MTEKCDRVGKWYRPCEWELIYDYKGPCKALRRQINTAWAVPLWLAKLGVESETYAGALCRTCGKVIRKDEIEKDENGTE